jgi:hypothetical protein
MHLTLKSRPLSWARTAADIEVWEVFIAVSPRRLTDGGKASGPMMRRRVNGPWEYRRMSEGEMREYLSSDAW